MPRSFHTVIPNSQMLLALEPEELAGYLLEYLKSSAEDNQQLNRYNFAHHQTVDGYPREDQEKILCALMEAWAWLEREGLIAPKPRETSGMWVFITRRGQALRNRGDVETFRRAAILPKALLHPLIAEKTWSAFIRGEYDTAIFQAFKAVEVTVRQVGRYQATDYGVALMREAFHPRNGRLTDMTLPEQEREAIAALFAGAIGSYKNPQSHRNVLLSDPAGEAVEMIMLASHLLRIVEGRAGDANTRIDAQQV